MFLVRCYVNAAFQYLSRQSYDGELVSDYLDMMRETPLSVNNIKVSDGLKYHVLDIWVDELDKVDRDRDRSCPVEELMKPVETLAKEGKTKTLRTRAKECAGDERLEDWKGQSKANGASAGDEEDEEWEGLGD